MMRRSLIALVLSAGIVVAPRAVPAQTSESPRAEAASGAFSELDEIAAGSAIAVELRDGTRMIGLLNGRDAKGILIQPTPSDEPRFVPYASIASVSARGDRWDALPTSGWIVVVASAAALVVVLVMLFRTRRIRRIDV